MNKREFLKELATLPEKGWNAWFQSSDVNSGYIRLSKDGDYHCPITAVCKELTGEDHIFALPGPASRKLRLRRDTIKTIIGGSDGYNDEFKEQLLKALKLKDD